MSDSAIPTNPETNESKQKLPAGKKRKLSLETKANIVLEIFLWIFAALLFLVPMYFILMNSFKPLGEIQAAPLAPFAGFFQDTPAGEFFFLENFFTAWETTKFPSVFLNTFFITALSVAGVILIASMAAYGMVRTPYKKTGWLLYGFFTFAMLIPFQVLMVPLGRMAVDLNLLGMGDWFSGNDWLQSFFRTMGIVPMYWGLLIPLAIFMYHGFIKGVPLSLEESAHIDGAGVFTTFFRVVFPLLTPITATIIILDVLWVWNDFLLPLIILRTGTLQLALNSFFGQFVAEYGKAMAALVLSSLPVVIFYITLQRYIIKGIASGAVKG